MSWKKQEPVVTLLSAVTATGAGSTKTARLGNKPVDKLRYYIVAATITTGGTVKIQGSEDGTVWFDLATVAITATGNTAGTIDGPIPRYYRANLTARTDGTYTVTSEISREY